MVKTIVIIVVSVIALTFIIDLIKGTPEPIVRTVTVQTQVDTTAILKKYRSELKPVIKTRYITKRIDVNLDSLRASIIEQIQDTTEYVAEAVANYEDSLAVVNVRYVSPYIPLSHLGYFDIEVMYKELTINIKEETTITVEHQQGWFAKFIDRFNVGIYAGIGMGLRSGFVEPQVGIGFQFEL